MPSRSAPALSRGAATSGVRLLWDAGTCLGEGLRDIGANTEDVIPGTRCLLSTVFYTVKMFEAQMTMFSEH